MGNFRHQSIRTTERGAEKEVDKERERDLRDREGQERLRNVSYTGPCVHIVGLCGCRSFPTNTTATGSHCHLYRPFVTKTGTPRHI